jgi:hypothetical protein
MLQKQPRERDHPLPESDRRTLGAAVFAVLEPTEIDREDPSFAPSTFPEFV